jgi:HAD superfamily hydrolase (TIGR01549 family)/HAD superfamily hydrolase (TIGR01509 family)
MTIQAVFFDMGGTIQTFSYNRELRLAATPGLRVVLEAAGISLSLDDQQLLDLITRGLKHYHQWSVQTMQELTPAQVWREYILHEYHLPPQVVEAVSEEAMVYIESHFYERVMRPEVPDVLEAIRRQGLKIGLISNVCSRSQVPNDLEKYGITHYFNPVVLSSEYGRRKPDPAIFHYAARLGNTPTSECLYVGDRIARDIVGARKAGYRYAVQVKHHFKHGEADEGDVPDAVIENMCELLDILKRDRLASMAIESDASKDSKQIRAFIFDAGDILYFRPERGGKLAKFLQEEGFHCADCQPVERNNLVQQAYRGLINQDQYREAILRLYGVAQPELIERGKVVLAEEDDGVQFFEGVRQTLMDLKNSGFYLAIVTDTANPIYVKLGWFEQGGFGHVWDSIISSQEIGVRKPDPGIYHAALQQLGITADQAVFVGHKISELNGAKAVGMKTVAFNFEEDARADFYLEKFSDLLNLPMLVTW